MRCSQGSISRFSRCFVKVLQGSLHFLLGEACGPVCSIFLKVLQGARSFSPEGLLARFLKRCVYFCQGLPGLIQGSMYFLPREAADEVFSEVCSSLCNVQVLQESLQFLAREAECRSSMEAHFSSRSPLFLILRP